MRGFSGYGPGFRFERAAVGPGKVGFSGLGFWI